ncbi:MAG TPA: ABC transporter ATP-binding protein [Nocardioidaceae bacterium]|nr:ABC transporter ATP-binding protein [Nocardioidaceae bacterium]
MSDAGLLEVSDLSVRFRTDEAPVHAVDNLSFTLHEREILAVVGESGCGKSVSALAVLGLLPPAGEMVSGSIRLDGVDLAGLSAAQLRAIRGKDISMVFQEPMTSLNPVLRVGHQIAEVLRRHEGVSRRAARSRAVELLSLVGIPAPQSRVDDYAHQMSGGMRQRVMIAMALACNPKVLIADEPTTALDVTIQAGILDLMREVRDRFGTAIVLITHDLGVVADMADRAIVMYAGRKVEEARIDELFAHPQHPYTMGLLGAVPHPGQAASAGEQRRLTEIRGRVPVLHEPAGHCAFAPRCDRADDLSRAQLPQLHEERPGHLVACFHPGREGGA